MMAMTTMMIMMVIKTIYDDNDEEDDDDAGECIRMRLTRQSKRWSLALSCLSEAPRSLLSWQQAQPPASGMLGTPMAALF